MNVCLLLLPERCIPIAESVLASDARLWVEPCEFTVLDCEAAGPTDPALRTTGAPMDPLLRLIDASLTAPDRRLLIDTSLGRVTAGAPGLSLIETSVEATPSLSFREPGRFPIRKRRFENTLTPGHRGRGPLGNGATSVHAREFE